MISDPPALATFSPNQMSSTEDITESYEEDSPESLKKQLLLDAQEALEGKAGEGIARRLKKIAKKADERTKEAIDGMIAANAPEKGGDSPEEKLVYACALGQISSDSGYFCTPSCLEGYHLNDTPACDMVVYEKKDGSLRKVNKITGKRVCLYVDTETSENDFKAIYEREKYDELFVYFYDEETGRYAHTMTRSAPREKKSKKRRDRDAAAVILVIVLLFFLIALAVWLRYAEK